MELADLSQSIIPAEFHEAANFLKSETNKIYTKELGIHSLFDIKKAKVDHQNNKVHFLIIPRSFKALLYSLLCR